MKAIDAVLLLLFVLVLYTKFVVSGKFPFFSNANFDVRIINGFSDNSTLTVWCVPNDGSDISRPALQERGEYYSWTVKISHIFWGPPPVFVCTAKWEKRRTKFEAFRESRDRNRCGDGGKCLWLVKEDGVYFGNNGVSWIKSFPWMTL